MIFDAFMLGSSEPRARSALASRSINLFPERVSGEGKSDMVLLGTPGTRLFAGLTAYADGPRDILTIHGAQPSSDRFFATVGEHLLEFNQAGVIVHDFEPVTPTGQPFSGMIYSGSQIFVNGGNGNYFVYGLLTGWTGTPVTESIGNANLFETIDGYILAAAEGNSNCQFFISGINDATAWDALDFSAADRIPGVILAILRQGDVIWFFKTGSIEGFQNTGNADFPFESIQAALIPIGVVPGSVARVGNEIFFMARQPGGSVEVHRLTGYGSERVSTHAEEKKLNRTLEGVPGIQGCHAVGRTLEGHLTYQVTTLDQVNGLPQDTLCYDLSTNQWHERYLRDTLNREFLAHDLIRHTSAWGGHYVVFGTVGDLPSFAIFEESLDIYTDEALSFTQPTLAPLDTIKPERIAPYLTDENKEVQFPGLELVMDLGVGNSWQLQPEATLSWSDDNGENWTKEAPRRIGVEGKFRGRVRWQNLGKGRNRMFKISFSGGFKVAITNCILIDPIILAT